MPVLTIRPNGLSLIQPPAIDRPITFGRRGLITGWSRQASRRHTRWVQSVDEDELDGYGVAITLTTRLMAAGPDELYRTLERWWKRQQARGALRMHWVRENHADGRPHFHVGIYYADKPTKRDLAEVVRDWVECAADLRPASIGQDAQLMPRHRGWGQYCAKHSARSVSSYQRTGMPKGWTRCGRLWGHFGVWPLREDRYVVDEATGDALRHLLFSWRRQDAAAALNKAAAAAAAAKSPRGQKQAAHHVRCASSRVESIAKMEDNALRMRRGVAEWTEAREALRMLHEAAEASDGFVVLMEEGVDADGVVFPWRVIRHRVELELPRADVPEAQPYDQLPNDLSLDRDALLHLNAPTSATPQQLAEGAIFALERKARRVDQGEKRTPRWANQRRQLRAIKQPGITVGRRDASRSLLGLADA